MVLSSIKKQKSFKTNCMHLFSAPHLLWQPQINSVHLDSLSSLIFIEVCI